MRNKKQEINIFNEMYGICLKQTDVVNTMRDNLENIGIDDITIPNVGITFENKLKELECQLAENRQELNMKEYEKYGVYSKKYFEISKVNSDVIDDMINELLDVTKILKKSSDVIEDLVQVKYKETNETGIKPIGKMDKITGKMKQVFKIQARVNVEREIENLKEQLSIYTNKYKEKDNIIKEYKINK